MLEQAKEMLELAKQEVRNIQYSKIKNVAVSVKNEVLEMIERVREKMDRLALLIVSAKYLAKIPNRDKVQDIDNATNFLERNNITTFAQLEKYKTDKGKEFDSLAFAEVISYNKANLERVEQNENRQQNRQQTASRTVGRTKRKEEEL